MISKLNRVSLAFAMIPGLAACDRTADELEMLARQTLLYPDSAQFGELRQGKVGGHAFACLMVGAKNRQGVQVEPTARGFVQDGQGNWHQADLPDEMNMTDCTEMLEASLSGANSDGGKSTRKVANDVPFHASKAFDPADVSWFDGKEGENVILGSASLRTKAGNAIPCPSEEARVTLIPDSGYARERMEWLYGSQEGGFISARDGSKDDFPSRIYEQSLRTATCDDQGNFAFGNLPDGTYFLTATVGWRKIATDGSVLWEGGGLMRRVQVSGGQRVQIKLGSS